MILGRTGNVQYECRASFHPGGKEGKGGVKLPDFQQFSNYGPWASGISAIWKLVKKAKFSASPQTD